VKPGTSQGRKMGEEKEREEGSTTKSRKSKFLRGLSASKKESNQENRPHAERESDRGPPGKSNLKGSRRTTPPKKWVGKAYMLNRGKGKSTGWSKSKTGRHLATIGGGRKMTPGEAEVGEKKQKN